MSKEEVLEYNPLIVLFMGAKYYPKVKWYQFPMWNDCYVFPKSNIGAVGFAVRHLKYHTSWDWLISVITRISDIKSDEVENYWANTATVDIRKYRETFDVTYMEVVKFIQWYNNFEK